MISPARKASHLVWNEAALKIRELREAGTTKAKIEAAVNVILSGADRENSGGDRRGELQQEQA